MKTMGVITALCSVFILPGALINLFPPSSQTLVIHYAVKRESISHRHTKGGGSGDVSLTETGIKNSTKHFPKGAVTSTESNMNFILF